MHSAHTQCGGCGDVAGIIVDEEAVGEVKAESGSQPLIESGIGLAHFFGAGYQYAVEPVEKVEALQGYGPGFGRPVGEGIERVAAIGFEVAQEIDGFGDGAAQHFGPAAIEGTYFMGIFGVALQQPVSSFC